MIWWAASLIYGMGAGAATIIFRKLMDSGRYEPLRDMTGTWMIAAAIAFWPVLALALLVWFPASYATQYGKSPKGEKK